MTEIQKRLFAFEDRKYKNFNSSLIPNIEPESVIGVRTPILRKLAKELYGGQEAERFLHELPHKYFEENLLHAFLIEQIKDFPLCIEELERFLPYTDNWAVCDCMRPKVFKKHKAELLGRIRLWLESEHCYTKRYALGMLMAHFLDEDFKPEYLEWAAVSSEEYYVRMMVAWYFATALAKQYSAALPYIENGLPETWTHNKAIQKAVESRRIKDSDKVYLKTLKKRG